MSREAVLLQWERKIEAAERLEDESAEAASEQVAEATELAEPVPLRPESAPRRGRFERITPAPSAAPVEPVSEPVAERRTITITGRPTSPTGSPSGPSCWGCCWWPSPPAPRTPRYGAARRYAVLARPSRAFWPARHAFVAYTYRP